LDSSLFASAELNRIITATTLSSPLPLRFYQPTTEALNFLDIHSIVYNDQPYCNGDHFKISLVLKQFGVWRVAVHDTDIQTLFNIGPTEWRALLRLLHRFKHYTYTMQSPAPSSCDGQRDLVRNLLDLYFRCLPKLSVGRAIEFRSSLNYTEDDVRVTRTAAAPKEPRKTNESAIDPWILEQMRLAKCEWKRKIDANKTKTVPCDS
jgi:hypothetical protein